MKRFRHKPGSMVDARHADYQMLAESLPQLVFVNDGVGRPLYFNERWFAYTGISRAVAFTPDGWSEAIHPDDRERALRLYATTIAAAREAYEIEYRLVRPSGETRWFLARALPERDANGTIVRWFGTCTDIDDVKRVKSIEASLAATEQRYRELADWLPIVITTRDPNGKLLYLNAAWYRYTGQDPGELSNSTWADAIHPDDLAHTRRARGDSIREGRPIKAELRVRRSDGVYRWFLNRSVPVRSVSGPVTSWIGTMTDIDEHKQAEETLRIINDASAVFGSVLDVDVALQQLAELVVRHLADTCTVDVMLPDGSLWNAAVAGRLPERARLLRERVFRVRRSEYGLSWQVAQTGKTFRTPFLTPQDMMAWLPADAWETRSMVMALGRRAFLMVPIVVDGRVFGTLGLANAETGRTFTEEDERLTMLIAQRAAIAIANASAYQRQREVARKLQSSFLPTSLPTASRLAFDGVYVAGSDDLTIGGDWYDAFLNKAGTYGFSIGDIEGHGLEAAVLMGKMRQTLNTLAFADLDPAEALAVADGVLEREHPDTFATAFAARFDHRENMLEYANAGHPAPFVLAADGAVRRLAPADVPVGLGELHPRSTHLESLRTGDLLFAFTDGLIELTRDLEEGERNVLAALSHPAFHTCSAPAKLLCALVVPPFTTDDIAILALRVGGNLGWSFDARDPVAGQRARGEFFERLALEGIGADACLPYEIVFGEIVANVARYTPGALDICLRRAGFDLIVAALDRGPGFVWSPVRPADDSERGRGLFLIDTIASKVWTDHIVGFGSYIEVTIAITSPLS